MNSDYSFSDKKNSKFSTNTRINARNDIDISIRKNNGFEDHKNNLDRPESNCFM